MDRAKRWIGILTAVQTMACQTPPPDWCAEVEDSIVIKDPPTESMVALTEVWAVGGLNEGQEFMFPMAAAIDQEAGRIAIVDLQLGSITVVGPSGEWLGRLTKPGRGPGEFLRPIAVDWSTDGHLVLLDAGNSKILELEIDGSVVDESTVDQQFMASLIGSGMMWASLRNGEIFGQPAPRLAPSGEEAEYVILRARSFGAEVDTIIRSVIDMFRPGDFMSVPLPGQAIPVGVPLEGGALVLAGDVPEYRIRKLDGDGTVQRQLCWDIDALPFTAKETRGVAGAQIPGLQEDLDRVQPRGALARIGRLMADGSGALWVQRDRVSPLIMMDRMIGPEGAQFDIFDRRWEYSRSVRAPDRVRIVAVGGNLAIGIRRGELDEISVVGFRVPDE